MSLVLPRDLRRYKYFQTLPRQNVRHGEEDQGTEDVDGVEHGEGHHQMVEISLRTIFNKLYSNLSLEFSTIPR